MDKDELLDLMREFCDSPLSVLEIEDDDFKLRMEKPAADGVAPSRQPCAPPPAPPMGWPGYGAQMPPYGYGAPDAAGLGVPADETPVTGQMPAWPYPSNASAGAAPAASADAPAAGSENPAQGASAESSSESLLEVKAPLVGVFYTRPTPEEQPYVSVGDHVETGDVLGLVEAMKMINEIKSPVAGTVHKVLHKEGDAVGYDELLMLIETDG